MSSSTMAFSNVQLRFLLIAPAVVILIFFTGYHAYGQSAVHIPHTTDSKLSLAKIGNFSLLDSSGNSSYSPLASSVPQPEYIKSQTPEFPPQLTKADGYDDLLRGLSQIDQARRNSSDLSHLKYAILLPTYRGHFNEIIHFLESFKCLCQDYLEFDIHVILSDSIEVEELRYRLLDLLQDCPSPFGLFDIAPENRERSTPKVNLVNLYDILPEYLQTLAQPNDTSPLINKWGRYKYQGIKKLASARFFDYDYGLWLDSEALVVQPFKLRDVFDAFVKEPIFWRSRIANGETERNIIREAAHVLGRSGESFGTRYWNLESAEWFVEKAVIDDMFEWVAMAHHQDFWEVWLATPVWAFEICIYVMHIQARKLETVDSIFSKYKILETERELVRYGLAPGIKEIAHRTGTGFFERIYLLLKQPGMQAPLSAFMNRYHVRLQRLDSLDVTDRFTLQHWLLDSPIYMLVCGAPDLHGWWLKSEPTNPEIEQGWDVNSEK